MSLQQLGRWPATQLVACGWAGLLLLFGSLRGGKQGLQPGPGGVQARGCSLLGVRCARCAVLL